MPKKVTVTDIKPDGSPGHLHGKTAELLIHRYDTMLELDRGLAYIEHTTEWSKGLLVPVWKQFEEGKWVRTEEYTFASTMADSEIDHWLTLLRLKG